MKTASISELKQELTGIPPVQVIELCLRLAKFKKDNKELLTYLLFESHDPEAYILSVKAYIDEEFTELPKTSVYFIKKALRRVLKSVNKYIKYAGDKQVETELLLHFCSKVKEASVPMEKGTVINNLFQQQLKKIKTAIDSQHEDLQHDYRRALLAITG